MEFSRIALDEAARKELLALARGTLEGYFTAGKIPASRPANPQLLERSAAFVTLHEGEELRGCIGYLSDDGEMYRTVQRCAISAALEDTRFRPVTREEIPGLKIEISVLTQPQRIRDVELIEVGRHGLIVALGRQRGLLLPQVAAGLNWDRETFLGQTCRKAGLNAHAWKQPDAIIQIFEAQVFSE